MGLNREAVYHIINTEREYQDKTYDPNQRLTSGGNERTTRFRGGVAIECGLA